MPMGTQLAFCRKLNRSRINDSHIMNTQITAFIRIIQNKTPLWALAIIMVGGVLAGCSTTTQLVSDAMDSINDLDYFLGKKEPTEQTPNRPAPGMTPVAYTPSTLAIDPSAAACLMSEDPRFAYRKKIAFTGLTLSNPAQVVDIPDLHRAYPRALMRRFNRANYVVIDATESQITTKFPEHLGGTAEIIRSVARELNVQFIVTGQVLDARYHNSTDSYYKRSKKFLFGKSDTRARQLDMQLSLYDGTTGQLIDESFYQGSAEDRINLAKKDVGLTDAYLESDFGQLTDTFLAHQSRWLQEALSCLPLQARVSAVTGSGITFATGTESLLLPGDRLVLKRRVQLPAALSQTPGYRFENNGSVVVTQVYPNGALASFVDSTPPFEVHKGDIVQAW